MIAIVKAGAATSPLKCRVVGTPPPFRFTGAASRLPRTLRRISASSPTSASTQNTSVVIRF